MEKPKARYQWPCPYCTTPFNSNSRKPQAWDCCPAPACRAKSDVDYQAALAAYNSPERKAARKAARAARTPVALYGDYAMLAAFNGVATDGTGRKTRTRR